MTSLSGFQLWNRSITHAITHPRDTVQNNRYWRSVTRLVRDESRSELKLPVFDEQRPERLYLDPRRLGNTLYAWPIRQEVPPLPSRTSQYCKKPNWRAEIAKSAHLKRHIQSCHNKNEQHQYNAQTEPHLARLVSYCPCFLWISKSISLEWFKLLKRY